MAFFHRFAVVVAALAMSYSGPAVARDGLLRQVDGPSASAQCAPKKLAIRTVTGTSTTMSNAFVKVKGSRISFTQGGKSESCVVVRVSGEASSSGAANVMYLRAVLDGQEIGSPPIVQFADSTVVASTAHAIDFLFKKVAPGSHDLVLQFSSLDGSEVYFNSKTIIVQHR